MVLKKNGGRDSAIEALVSQGRRVASSRLRSRPVGRPPSVLSSGLGAAYLATLRDPWENPPIKLGYLSCTPTVLATATARSSLTVNADGSFALALQPSVKNMILTNNAGNAVATWTGLDAANRAAITAQFMEARIVSGGLRAFALFPETSASGVLFAAAVPTNGTTLQLTTATGLSGYPSSELGIGTRGARAVMTPVDVDAAVFHAEISDGTGYSGAFFPVTTPYICGLGFPVGTVIWYEAVLNLEGIPNALLGASSTIGLDSDLAPTLQDRLPNFESAARAARALLGNAAVMDAAVGLGGLIHPGIGVAMSATRSVFGQGRHFRQAQLVAGASEAAHGRQNSIVIEEMKEESGFRQRRR